MAAISKIEIEGFKAFPEKFSLELGGNNLLMYGENGSGKSSIYYALHALLQSVFKDDKGAKYFKIIEDTSTGEGSLGSDENLVNIYRFGDVKKNVFQPYIKITLDNGHVWKLDRGGLQSANGEDFREIRTLNTTAIFINHSYISRFHSARNSENIDLWNVFIKDILPFYVKINEDKSLADVYYEIIAERPKGKTEIDNLKKRIQNFNDRLYNDIIGEINKYATDTYNKYFRNEDDPELLITLLYYASDDEKNNHLHEDFYLAYDKFSGTQYSIRYPRIGINIISDGQPIYKPQSFFNEAKLTAIALSVRFALLNLDNPDGGSFLALDDMLISLDMSNRMKVVNYLLDVVVKKYKLYLFTHDKFFYTTMKKRILIEKMQREWIMGGLYMHDVDENNDYNPCLPYPKFIVDKDKQLEIMEYYAKHDYPACGQKLRKWCEEILEKLYPDTLKNRIDATSGNTVPLSLNDRINNLSVYCEKENMDFSKFKNLKIYKDNVLNTVSHYDIQSPIYKEEILNVVKVLNELNKVNIGRKEIKVNHAMGIELIKPDGIPVTICIDIKKDKILLYNFSGDYRISYYTKCWVKEIIISDVHQKLPIEEVYDSVYDVYNKYCDNYGLPNIDNLLDVIIDHGTKLRDKILP